MTIILPRPHPPDGGGGLGGEWISHPQIYIRNQMANIRMRKVLMVRRRSWFFIIIMNG